MAPAPDPISRERSPVLVDDRYKINNVIYREERHNTRRTPSRYARYESVRLENDRARSRSPVYVKVGSQSGQYQQRSPGGHILPSEPIYRVAPPPPEEMLYEKARPRQDFYRVYADEPEAYELVRVADESGEFMIRRPVRREPAPVYAYGRESFSRASVYEGRSVAPREDSTFDEEYDPRHPAPPPPATVRQVRYQ
jgi:hypothetical protein